MKQALLVVSFGTSVPKARESIAAVEQALAAHAPCFDFYRAFTSPTIRGILAKRGEAVLSLAEALEQLAGAGYERVLVQPTHLLYGIEHDKIKETVAGFIPRFARLALGKPLVAGSGELQALAACVAECYMPKTGALVLLGHGTEHFANMVYPALQTALRLAGVKNAYVGTVEGWPGFDEVLSQLRADGHQAVRLTPLMLVAGDHALHDMAGGEPGSWQSRLEQEGFAVCCGLQGLGVLPGVQALYKTHLQELLHEL